MTTPASHPRPNDSSSNVPPLVSINAYRKDDASLVMAQRATVRAVWFRSWEDMALRDGEEEEDDRGVEEKAGVDTTNVENDDDEDDDLVAEDGGVGAGMRGRIRRETEEVDTDDNDDHDEALLPMHTWRITVVMAELRLMVCGWILLWTSSNKLSSSRPGGVVNRMM